MHIYSLNFVAKVWYYQSSVTDWNGSTGCKRWYLLNIGWTRVEQIRFKADRHANHIDVFFLPCSWLRVVYGVATCSCAQLDLKPRGELTVQAKVYKSEGSADNEKQPGRCPTDTYLIHSPACVLSELSGHQCNKVMGSSLHSPPPPPPPAH